jgi:beta-lactamase regulating signal transducer with metallopeptidase domain
MNDFDGFLSTAALVALKASILLVAAFALGLAARKSSASTRHALWAVTFAFLLLIPAMAFLSHVQEKVSIRLPVLPSPGRAAALNEASIAPAPRASHGVPVAPRAAAPTSPERDWARTAGWIWALGTAILIARLGLGLLSSRRVLASSEPVLERDWKDRVGEGRERLGISREVALHRSDRVVLPLTMGVMRSAILLPLDSGGYSLSRRSAVILHELAHVRRRDCASQLLGQLAAAAFWWNPLVWVATRQMRLLSERASDDLVLGAGARPSDYAHDLLDMARSLKGERATPLGSVAMAHRSRFEERLLAILDPRVSRGAVSARFVVAAGVLALPFVLSLAVVAPTAAIEPAAAQVEELERPVPAEPVATPPEAGLRPQAAPEPQERQEAQETSTARESEEPRGPEERAAFERAKAALGEALDDPEESVREQALFALIQSGDSSVAPYLEKALSDSNPSARAQAAWGLGQLRREESAPALAAALQDAEEEVRSQAAWALGMIRSRASVPGLIGALSDESAEVKSQAAWALGLIRDASAVEGLTRALKDSDAEVRSQAAWALGLIVLAEDDDHDEDDDDVPDAPEPPPPPDPRIVPERGGPGLRGASL